MTAPPSPTAPTTRGGVVGMVVAFVFGFVIAIVIDFILSLGAFSFQGTSSAPGAGQIVMSWLVTGAAFWILYKMHRWAAYGMLGGFASLFVLLALVGGALGPYTCFSTYGYPPLR